MEEVFQVSNVEIKTHPSHKKSIKVRVNIRQLFIGSSVFVFGALFYYLFRSQEHTYFLKYFEITPYLKDFLPSWFVMFGNSLPTFLHVFAFSLMTASLTTSKKKGYVIVCLFWFAVDVLFEIGQVLNKIMIQIIPNWFSEFLFLENTKNYFLHGQFDRFDLLSIALGSIAAYILLIYTKGERVEHEKKSFCNF